jgi:hypothetical protein
VIVLRTCANCGYQYVNGRLGVCNACGNFKRRHGHLPEAHEIRSRQQEFTPCTHCGQTLASRNGLCQACDKWQRKHGEPRPKTQWCKPKVCCRCKEAKVYVKGLCVACYQYKRANGRNRPRYRWAEQCSNCKRSGVPLVKGRCQACQQYYWRHGVERPAHLWQRWNPLALPKQQGMRHCKVCGKPQAALSHGRCQTCYTYKRRHKQDRAPWMWQRWAPHGWCECGQPAVTTVTLSVDHGATEYRLCKECYEVEQGALR